MSTPRPALDVRPVTLAGFGVTLRPYVPADAAALHAVSPSETFRYYPFQPADDSLASFERFMQSALDDATRLTFVVEHAGRVVGSTSYLDIRPKHLGVEIGCTWYGLTSRGTTINPAAKLLLLSHAFDTLGCERVQLKCDARNTPSVRGITKLGAVFEGTLRKHLVMSDGYIRDTAMFSVVRSEWPAVQEGLRRRAEGTVAKETSP